MIVIARGGGSVEDLLPFSDEGLVRAVAAATHPGGLGDRPRARHARCSTWSPTSAPPRPPTPPSGWCPTSSRSSHRRRPGPRAAAQAGSRQLARARAAAARRAPLTARARRPAQRCSTSARREVDELRDRARRSLRHRLDRAADDLDHQRARVRALSPLATLRRGYAVAPGRRRPRRHLGRQAVTPAGALRSGSPTAGVAWPPPTAPKPIDRLSRPETTHELTRPRTASRAPLRGGPRGADRGGRTLEPGGTTLEESLALWERGEELATVCQDWLDGARKRLDAVIDADEDG